MKLVGDAAGSCGQFIVLRFEIYVLFFVLLFYIVNVRYNIGNFEINLCLKFFKCRVNFSFDFFGYEPSLGLQNFRIYHLKWLVN